MVSLLEEQVDIKAYGGTMRLGKSDTHLKAGTRHPRGLRRGGDRGAPPPPLRGVQPVPQATWRRRASS